MLRFFSIGKYTYYVIFDSDYEYIIETSLRRVVLPPEGRNCPSGWRLRTSSLEAHLCYHNTENIVLWIFLCWLSIFYLDFFSQKVKLLDGKNGFRYMSNNSLKTNVHCWNSWCYIWYCKRKWKSMFLRSMDSVKTLKIIKLFWIG